MKMATETTPLTSGDESRTYLFLSQRHRNRRNKIRQFQCCVCAAMLGIFVTAMVITVSYSMNHDPDDDLDSNETDTNTQVLLPAPVNTAALKTLLSLQWPRPDFPPPDWPAPIPTDAQIAEAIEAGEMSLKNKDDLEARAAMKSDDPASPGILKLGTPSYIHQEAIKTSPLATKAARVGYIIEKATEQLMKGKSPKHSVGKGPEVNPYWIPTGMVCKAKGPTGGINGSFPACPPLRYRTMDGTCNNLVHPDWGVAMRPLRRVLPPDYSDGISSPRVAKDGSGLPSARDVSLTVHRPIYRNDPHFTVMLAVWGQFFDHDITATALSKSNDGAAISCCTSDGMMATENVNPACYPVVLSPEDPYYADYGITCMNFVRSAPAPICNLGSREQLNQITSFIDGSVIYGSSDEQAKHLRSPSKKGELAMMITPDGRELLPASLDPRDGCNQPDMNADGKYCFKSGDSRANENLHLTTLHLLMAREHNRIVRALSKMNPTWSDERLYQEGRHIVSAQMQHITYNEFLPVVLGQSMMTRLKLAPLEEGYFKGYDPEVNAAVANNFATAAFRFAHTLLPTLMKILGNDTSSEEYVELHKILFNPYALYYPGKMDSTLKGALNTDVQRVDTYITPEVTQHLFQQKWSEDYDSAMEKAGSKFKGKKKGYGLDLASLNVQRGRDHGLPSYPEWREHCGLSRPHSFSDLNGEMDEAALERLASLYKTVDDVDMYSGSLSEIPVGEGLLGPTFSCLIADQFLRLKTGDRYWYETSELPQAFTPEQLAEIRRISLASIICENSGVDRVQLRVMQAVDGSNPRLMCEYIPQLRLEAWQDKSMVGRVKLSPFSMHVKVAPKKLQEPIPPSVTAGSLFIKGTVTSASINALGSDGTAILAMQPSTTFPVTLPVHLFDQKVPVSASTDFPDGIIPPFYHGGGGVTWTGSLTSSDPTKAHLEGSFSVPVFKHGATAFDFSMATYTGSFDIYLNLVSSFSPLGVPTLQGTYNSGIYFKTELSTMANSQPSIQDYENLIAKSDTSGPKLPMAPVFLYGTYSLDHTEFYWDGNVSLILPSPTIPIVTASMGGMVKPKIASTAVDVSAVWGVVKAVAGPPLNPVSGNSKTVVTTWWDGTLPVAIPQPAFDRSVGVPATSKATNTGDGVTWSGSMTPVDGSDDVQLNGTFSFPVFHHGVTLSGFTLQIWRGNFSIILRSSPTPGVMPLAMSLRSLATGDMYKSPLYFRAGPEEMSTLDDDSIPSNVTIPVILHGHTSIDKSIFYWNGNASIIVPKYSSNVLMAQEKRFGGRGRGEPKYNRGGFDQKPYRLQATGGSPAEPLILTITSASVRMASTVNTNTTGKNIIWNGEFPVTLPQSPFYRKDPLALSKSNIDTDSPYSPLAASAGSAAVSYKSELTWSNLSGKMIDSSTNDLQINGSLSFPVFYFPSVTVGPWPGPTIENWNGNFSVVVNINSTTGPPVTADSILTLISMGNFTSSVYFTEESKSAESGKLAAAMSEDDSDVTTPLKVIMLLHGVKSLDKTEFYWNGVMTLIIRGLPTAGTLLSSYKLQATGGTFIEPLILKITSASVTMSSTMNTNSTGESITWNGDFPVTLPQSPFYRKGPMPAALNLSSRLTASAGPAAVSYKSELTWSNLSGKMIDSSTNDLQINGSLSFPVFYFPSVTVGPWPGPTIENWNGNFSVVVNINSTTGPPVTADSILTLISMGNFTSSVYFTEESKSAESGKLAAAMSEDDSDVTTPLKVIMLLHGVKSLDKTEFYWNGVMTLIIRGLPAAGTLLSSYKLRATSGTFIEPLILKITSASVTMSSTMNTNSTGESITWNGDFPVTLPQSPFYRKGPMPAALNLSSRLTASAGPAAISYKSELTWSNLSGKMIDSSTNDLQINGSLSFPVFYFPSVTVGPWPGPTIENWNGNFSVVVNINSTTGPPVTADSILTLISMGNFTSSIYFTEESTSAESGKLAAAMSEDDSDVTTPLKVIMLLHGVKSLDKTEFYWNGVMTLIIRGLPGVVPSSFVQSTYNVGIPSIPTRGSYISGRVTGGNVMGLSKSGKTYWWSGFFPVPIEMPAFDSVSPNAGVYNWPFVPTTFNGTGGVTWSGTISRQTSDINAISIKGSFKLPVFVHGNPSAFSVDEWNGDFDIEMDLFNNSPLIDKFKSGVYNSPMIFREEPDDQGGTSSSYLDTINKVQNVMMTAMLVSPTGTELASQPRVPIILWGKYSPDKSTFYWKGNVSVVFPAKPSFLFASKNKISAEIDSEVTPPSKNVKLPFKILTGSLSVKSPVFGKKILWDGKIPFTTLSSYFNGPSANTSYIGGPMKWTGRITRSTDVVNGAHIEGIYSLPVIVHTNGGVTTEAMTGDFSMSISFIGTRNLVDWAPNEGTYSSIITIAPGKPSDKALEEDTGPVVNMAINKLMKSMAEDLAEEDSDVMVLPACFFGDYDPLHFTFTGDGITIVPANVSALIKKKHKNTLWDVSPTDRLQIGHFPSYASNAVLPDPLTRSLRQIYPENDGIKNIKLPFKILSGSLTSMSPALGEKVLWDGQIPFTTPRSYFNHYSNSTSFIGGPMKWMGHVSRTAGNGAQIEGSFSVPIFVHSNDTVSVEAMTGDLSLQIRFSGTQNIFDLVPSKANFSTFINIGPAHPNIELSLREAQIESKSNMLLNMALSDIMNSIENEESDADALIAMPIWLFGYYDAENFTFNGDALAIIPANLSNPAPLEYEAIVQDMTPATKLKVGAASPYISGAVTSGNVMGLSKGGRTFWWSATLPLPISMPPFDSVSPDAGVFNWPFNPTSYNGTGGVTWSGSIVTTTSVKNGISVKGSFTVPIFTHGNPSAFSVDEWNGDFELEMSVFYNNTDMGSSFPTGTYNSPMFFRERKSTGPRDPSGYDLKAIKEVENMMILSTNLGISGGINSAMPRVPVILWGNYSADKKVFYWEGNITAVFPPIHNILLTPLSDFYSEKDSEDTSSDKSLRLPMDIITGKITSTSPAFGEKILWDGTIPFTTLQSYFSKYSTNSSSIGGPVQWAGQISRDLTTGNAAKIKGSFAVPIFVPLNGTQSIEYLTGDFSFVVSFNGTQNIVDLVPNSGKFSSYIILGVSHDEFESYMGEPDDDEPSTQNEHLKIKMKQLTASITPEPGTSLTTAMPIIFLGNYGSLNFTFNGEAIAIIPVAKPLPANPKLLSSSLERKPPVDRFHDMPYSKRNMPSSPFNDLPYSIPFPSHFKPKPKVGRKVKIFGIVKSGQIYGGNLGHRTRPMWEGSFPALIPMPAFDRRSHHNESHAGHPHHPHRMDGGITWEATEIGESRDGGYLEGNFFFPIYKHGRYHTYSIKMWTGQFSFHFTLPGDQSIGKMVNYWKRYTSKMYFHHFHSDWDLFNPGSHADELRDKANKMENRINRSPNNGPIIILKGKQEKSIFSWSGKFILVFTV
ncbi:uncharacterized protein [Hetaerina americana]|uniref:uncharacterized protein n=1 Tax=Hetaerina americana TaxID=62018 RepID=UPI003A7F5AAE